MGYSRMLIVSVVNSLPQAAGYPAVAKLAYEYFEPHLYGKAFSVISMGSRLGSFASSLVIGAAIHDMGWRGATAVAPLPTLAVLGFSMIALRKANGKASTPVIVEHAEKLTEEQQRPAGAGQQPS